MRKRHKIAAAGTLALTLVSGYALADSDVWTRANKTPGRLAEEQGALLKLAGREEKRKAAASIDPMTGRARIRAGTAAAGATGTFTAKLTADGLNDTLTFRYAQSGGRRTLLPSPDLGYGLTLLPDGSALVE